MKLRKYFPTAAALILVLGLCFGAMAQSKARGSFAQLPEPIMPTVSVNAIEVADGVIGSFSGTKDETVFGYSFLGRTTGSLPGSFTLSMNCTPAIPLPGGTSDVMSGAWTLPVYTMSMKGSTGYAGSLYGTIAKGTMNWDKTANNAAVYFVLSVDGGTQSWDGVRGYASFSGTIFVDEKTQKTMLTGDLVFSIMAN